MTPPDASKEPELKPCPHCGQEVQMYGDPEEIDFNCFSIFCTDCLLAMESCGRDKESLIATWNTRKP